MQSRHVTPRFAALTLSGLLLLLTPSCGASGNEAAPQNARTNERAANASPSKGDNANTSSAAPASANSANTQAQTDTAPRAPGALKKCQPENVPRPAGVGPQIDMNAVEARTTGASDLNEVLRNLFGDYEVDDGYDPPFIEGDFNGDDCGDIAVVVRHTDKYHDVRDLNQAVSNAHAELTITNARTGATLTPEENARRAAVLPANVRPREPRALAVIHGGPNGWAWKAGGAGRLFLVLDAVPRPVQPGGARSEFYKLEREGGGEEPRAEELPAAAKGDGIYVAESARVAGDRHLYRNRAAVYFDGSKYTAAKLPDLAPKP